MEQKQPVKQSGTGTGLEILKAMGRSLLYMVIAAVVLNGLLPLTVMEKEMAPSFPEGVKMFLRMGAVFVLFVDPALHWADLRVNEAELGGSRDVPRQAEKVNLLCFLLVCAAAWMGWEWIRNSIGYKRTNWLIPPMYGPHYFHTYDEAQLLWWSGYLIPPMVTAAGLVLLIGVKRKLKWATWLVRSVKERVGAFRFGVNFVSVWFLWGVGAAEMAWNYGGFERYRWYYFGFRSDIKTVVWLMAFSPLLYLAWLTVLSPVQRQLSAANRQLKQGGELDLIAFVGRDGTVRDTTRKDLRPLVGRLRKRMTGGPLLSGNGRVIANFHFYAWRQLKSTSGCRRLILVVEKEQIGQPRRLHDLLEDFSGQGWMLYGVGRMSLTTGEAGEIFRDLPVTLGSQLDRRARAQWIQDQLWSGNGSRQEPLSVLSQLLDLPMEGDALRGVAKAIQGLQQDYDEVESFYQLLKLAEYILHIRALLSTGPGAKQAFPVSPSFGSMEERQRGWSGRSAWPERGSDGERQLLESVALLEKEGTGKGGKGKQDSYTRACAALANLYNCYVGHGTLAYRVTPELAMALLTVVGWMIRDLQGQERFPGPEDLVTVKGCAAPVPACVIREGRYYLLSFVSLPRGVEPEERAPAWCEYLCYEDGSFCYTGQREQEFRLDLSWEEGTA